MKAKLKTKPAEKRKPGRPTIYTDTLAAKICALYAEGTSLREIECIAGMPTKTTILQWVFDNKAFSDLYARAQEIRTEMDAEDLKDIADDGSNDWMERHDKDGNFIGWRENGEAVRRSVLRVDARKWLMARRLPRKYGDRLQTEVSGPGGKPLVFQVKKIGE